MDILLASVGANFQIFTESLEEGGAAVTRCSAGVEVRSLLKTGSYTAVVVDTLLDDGDGLAFVQCLAREYPLVNCALASALEAEEFHEKTEGLGLFMQLPPVPGKREARKMLELLAKIDGLLLS